jgi:hypothetical protein
MNERRAVNSLIWIVCGILVIILRTVILQSTSILVWEALGLGMIAYGGAKLVWVLVRRTPTNTSSS